ncbi:GNAT family N-acetyltransferase [Cochlodiniinecator piscidefendens]|uniref:GNAT family N-acetyltransferase n=1 Tax=Cochlodiniinecator piscidefendens TaxID=2715756 RepID=UPI0014073CC5
MVLSVLERPLDPDILLMDGIFVSPKARDMGIGTALLSAMKEKAAQLHYSSVRLDVIDINPRARGLYERQGFKASTTMATRLCSQTIKTLLRLAFRHKKGACKAPFSQA